MKSCRFNLSLQHLLTGCSDNTYCRASIYTAGLNQKLNRALFCLNLRL